MPEYQPIIKKRIGFLAAAALGLSAFLITCVTSCTVLCFYGMHIASDKTDGLVSLAERSIRGLPQLARALPPALCDLLDDTRRPDYAAHIEVKTQLAPAVPGEPARVVIEAANNGGEMVTLLSLRVAVVDAQGRVIRESNEWAASPFAADDQWRGPLMPGSVRRFNACGWWGADDLDNLKAEVEITDVRVWTGREAPGADSSAAAELEADRPDLTNSEIVSN